MSGSKGGQPTIPGQGSTAPVTGAMPSYLQGGVGQPAPGQLEMIAAQLAQGGYGAPQSGGGDILQVLKQQYQGAPQAAAPQAAPVQAAAAPAAARASGGGLPRVITTKYGSDPVYTAKFDKAHPDVAAAMKTATKYSSR